MDTLSPERKAQIDAFLAEPLLARLASASPETLQPHVVPVWYAWDGEIFWINSYVTTRKIGELRDNPRCAVVVDVAESQMLTAGNIVELIPEVAVLPIEGEVHE